MVDNTLANRILSRLFQAVRRWTRRLLLLLISMAVLLVLIGVAVQTPPGKAILAGTISRLVARYTDLTLEIEGISGFLPGNVRIAAIHLRDPRGDFVSLQEVDARVSVSDLLRGRLYLSQLHISRLHVWQRPIPKQKWRIPRVPALPVWPTIDSLKIDTLVLGEDVLGTEAQLLVTARIKAVAGRLLPEVSAEISALESEATRVSLSYAFSEDAPLLFLDVHDETLLPSLLDVPPPFRAHIEGKGERKEWLGELLITAAAETILSGKARLAEGDDTQLQAELLARIDSVPFLNAYTAIVGKKVEATADIMLDSDGRLSVRECRLDSEVAAASLEGWLGFEEHAVDLAVHVAHNDVSGIPEGAVSGEKLPLAFDATFLGPFEAVAVAAKGSIQDEAILNAELLLGVADPLSLAATAQFIPGGFPAFSQLFEPWEAVRLELAANYDDEKGDIELARAEVSGIGLLLSAQGHIIPQAPSIALEARLHADDLSQAGRLISYPVSGAFEAALSIDGGADILTVDVDAQGDAIHLAWVDANRLSLQMKGQCEDWISLLPKNLKASIDARVEALVLPGVRSGDWSLKGEVDAPTMQQVNLDGIVLTDGNMHLDAAGMYAATENRFQLSADLSAASLSALPVNAEDLPDGTFQGSLHVQGGFGPTVVSAQCSGVFEELTNLSDPIAAIAGSRLGFSFHTALEDAEIRLTDLELSGDTFNVGASATYTLGAKTLNTEFRAGMPDMGPVGAGYAQRVAGALSVDGTLSGTLEDMALQAEIQGREIKINDLPALAISAELAGGVAAGSRPEVKVTARVQSGGEQVNISAAASYESGAINVFPLEFASGANEIQGRWAYLLDTRAQQAKFDLKLRDVAALGRMAGVPVSGSVDGSLTYENDLLSGALKGSTLSYGEVNVDQVHVEARALRQNDAMSVSASLEAARLTAGILQVNTVTAASEGNLQDARINAQLQGVLNTGIANPPVFTAKTGARLNMGERRLALDTLTGAVGPYEYGLEGNSSVEISDSGLLISPMNIHVGSGRIFLEARQSEDALSARVNLTAFPLGITALVMESPVKGILNGQILAGGSSAAPEISVRAELREGRLPLDASEAMAPLEATLESTLDRNGLAAVVEAAIPDVLEAKSRLTLPVRLRVSPWEMDVPRGAGLSGAADFSLHCLPLLHAFGLVEHYLERSVTGAFTLGGTVAAPDMRGHAVMQGARYENAMTGMVLRNLGLRLEAEGAALRLVDCAAETGPRGTMNATGEVRLHYEEQFPFNGTVHFENAQFAQLDFLEGYMTGTLNAGGTLQDILVKGELTVSPVHVSMPDELPVREPQVLDVVEIEEGRVVAQSERREAGFGNSVRLDIDCRIPGQVYVRAPILDSEWGGRLHVRGTLADILIDGRITVLRGHLDFLSRRFVLRDSALLFLGGAPTKPYLDMLAVVDTASLSARLKLQGELEEVKLELSSVPALPQDEILSHVLFGRDLSRISPVQAIQLARIASMFNRGLSGVPLFSGNIALPGIDRIDIRTGERADEAVVGIGKYFTDSVYVEVEQGTTTESGKVSVEVEVSPRVSVKGDVDAQERSGIGVFWRQDY